jgi:hypothetical protein
VSEVSEPASSIRGQAAEFGAGLVIRILVAPGPSDVDDAHDNS